MTHLPLLGGALHWAADAEKPSEDAFWLAASVPLLAPHTTVLDMACGAGAVGLALLARQPELMLTGLDCDTSALQAAALNSALNQRVVTWVQADALQQAFPKPWPVVLCNPPFHARAAGHHSPATRKALAHGLIDIALWCQAWQSAVAPGGSLYAILHAALETEIIEHFQTIGGTLRLAPLATHPAKPAKRLLVHWHHNGQPLACHACQVVPSYHSPLRQAVLYEAAALAAFTKA